MINRKILASNSVANLIITRYIAIAMYVYVILDTAIGKETIPIEEQRSLYSINMITLVTIETQVYASLSNSKHTLVKASPTQVSREGLDECRITFCSINSREKSVTQLLASKEFTRDQ